MSEREEYTPSMDEIKRWYAGAVDEYQCDMGMSMDAVEAAFDRAIAAHDRALREQIAQAIEAKADDPDPTLEPHYFVALDIAADIARGVATN